MVDVNSLLSTLSTVMWFVAAALVVGGVSYAIYYFKKFNKDVLIFDQTSGGNIIRIDKAKETYDEKNILCWTIRKEKVVKETPPKEAVCIYKGKKFACLVRVQGDQYHWLNTNEFKLDAEKKIGKYFVISEDAKRQFADQIKKAESERSSKMSQLLMQIVPFIAIAILLIGGYFIYDVVGTKMAEMSESFAGAAGQMAEVSKQNAESLKIINGLLQNKTTQSFGGEQQIQVVPPN